MAYKNLDEFHIDYDNQYILNVITTQNPSCPKCHPLERQSAEFLIGIKIDKQLRPLVSDQLKSSTDT